MKRETQSLKKVESSTLKECGKEKARGAFHRKCKSERRKVISFLSLHFFFLYDFFFFVFFFLFFYLKRKKCQGENVWNERAKTRGQKSERAEWELKGKLTPFFAFFFFLWFFFSLIFFFSFALKEKDARKKRLKHKGKNERAKGQAKSEKRKGKRASQKWEAKGQKGEPKVRSERAKGRSKSERA